MKTIDHITTVQTNTSGIICPNCQSSRHIKNGKENLQQRYKCKTCGKNYRNTTNSSIHRIHKKELIEKYIQCIQKGLPLRKAASETGISLKTSFAWRHKLLASISQKQTTQTSKNSTISTLILPYSEKGRKGEPRKANANRKVTSLFTLDNHGRLNIEQITTLNKFCNQATQNINEATTCLPDKTLPSLMRSNCTKISSSKKTAIKNVQQNLIAWIDKFRGVATKYLQHYWAWFQIMNEFEISQNQESILIEKCIAN